MKVRVAVVGLGKMGLSHLSLTRVHPDVDLVAMCDTSRMLIRILEKNTGMSGFTDTNEMLNEVKPDAIIVATPTRYHESLVRMAIERGIHVFCEKPLSLSAAVSEELAGLAESKGVVNQVGYNYRFVGAFREMKRLLDAGAIGTVSHVLAEAYGPVVLRPKGMSWRSQKDEGGGCLYDYAAHPVNLLNWFYGVPEAAGGSILNSIFSKDTDDEAYSNLRYSNGPSAQISVNWSDESFRKMTVKMTAWGSAGKIHADRSECQTFLRNEAPEQEGYTRGWNVRYATDLTDPVYFYVRGEEYSAQIDYFIQSILGKRTDNLNSFRRGAETDRVISMLRDDASAELAEVAASPAAAQAPRQRGFFSRR